MAQHCLLNSVISQEIIRESVSLKDAANLFKNNTISDSKDDSDILNEKKQKYFCYLFYQNLIANLPKELTKISEEIVEKKTKNIYKILLKRLVHFRPKAKKFLDYFPFISIKKDSEIKCYEEKNKVSKNDIILYSMKRNYGLSISISEGLIKFINIQKMTFIQGFQVDIKITQAYLENEGKYLVTKDENSNFTCINIWNVKTMSKLYTQKYSPNSPIIIRFLKTSMLDKKRYIILTDDNCICLLGQLKKSKKPYEHYTKVNINNTENEHRIIHDIEVSSISKTFSVFTENPSNFLIFIIEGEEIICIFNLENLKLPITKMVWSPFQENIMCMISNENPQVYQFFPKLNHKFIKMVEILREKRYALKKSSCISMCWSIGGKYAIFAINVEIDSQKSDSYLITWIANRNSVPQFHYLMNFFDNPMPFNKQIFNVSPNNIFEELCIVGCKDGKIFIANIEQNSIIIIINDITNSIIKNPLFPENGYFSIGNQVFSFQRLGTINFYSLCFNQCSNNDYNYQEFQFISEGSINTRGSSLTGKSLKINTSSNIILRTSVKKSFVDSNSLFSFKKPVNVIRKSDNRYKIETIPNPKIDYEELWMGYPYFSNKLQDEKLILQERRKDPLNTNRDLKNILEYIGRIKLKISKVNNAYFLNTNKSQEVCFICQSNKGQFYETKSDDKGNILNLYFHFNCIKYNNLLSISEDILVIKHKDLISKHLEFFEKYKSEFCSNCRNKKWTVKCSNDFCLKFFDGKKCAKLSGTFIDEKYYCFYCINKLKHSNEAKRFLSSSFYELLKYRNFNFNFNLNLNLNKEHDFIFSKDNNFGYNFIPQIGENVYFIPSRYKKYLAENFITLFNALPLKASISDLNVASPINCQVMDIRYHYCSVFSLFLQYKINSDKNKDPNILNNVIVEIFLNFYSNERNNSLTVYLTRSDSKIFLVPKSKYEQSLREFSKKTNQLSITNSIYTNLSGFQFQFQLKEISNHSIKGVAGENENGNENENKVCLNLKFYEIKKNSNSEENMINMKKSGKKFQQVQEKFAYDLSKQFFLFKGIQIDSSYSDFKKQIFIPKELIFERLKNGYYYTWMQLENDLFLFIDTLIKISVKNKNPWSEKKLFQKIIKWIQSNISNFHKFSNFRKVKLSNYALIKHLNVIIY